MFVLLPERDAYGDQNVQRVAAEQFKAETVFWKQLEIGQRIVLTKETRVLSELEPWLTHPDRADTNFGGVAYGRSSPLAEFAAAEALQERAKATRARVIRPRSGLPRLQHSTLLKCSPPARRPHPAGHTLRRLAMPACTGPGSCDGGCRRS